MAVTDVTIDYVDGEVTVDPDPVECRLPKDTKIRWTKTGKIQDWRVIFGAYAPVLEKSKMASPDNDTLDLVANRPEDLGHWKYVVVAETPDGLRDKDPEMIVER